MISHRFEPGHVHLLRLETGEDLLATLTAFVTDNGITAASITFLGAVRKAALRYYDQERRRYLDFEIDEHLEIASGVGNVSMLDGAPFVHIHAVLADAEGAAYGGHVNDGTEVFLCEVTIAELDGEAPIRRLDEASGLAVWGPAGA